jgi:DNA-binding beta-propeller fold protein YncE
MDHMRRIFGFALLALLLAAPAAHAQRRADGTIAGFAGTPGQAGFAGDGGPAGQALLNTPGDVTYLANGSVLIADELNGRIRRVAPGGTMFTAAGGGQCGSPGCGDGGPATDADLNRPLGVTALPDGGYLVADTFDHRIRRVFPNGRIERVAGSTQGLSGDGGPATQARLSRPGDVALLPDGSYLIADTGNHRIRHVTLDGRIFTIAGSTRGLSGDGGPATAAQLDSPRDVEVAGDGGFVIADTGNDRLRRVDLSGRIATLAGTVPGLSGDGTPARAAQLRQPFAVTALPNGGALVSDSANDRVRRVTPMGAIVAVAGGGAAGNGWPAESARLARPAGTVLAPGGGFLVSDSGTATIRRVTDLGAIPPAARQRSLFVEPAAGGVAVEPAGEPGGYRALREEDIVPNGSRVDATGGTLRLAVAADEAGTQRTTDVYSGAFTMRQLNGIRPFTEFRLDALAGCPVGGGARVSPRTAVAVKSARRRRRLWVRDSGGRWRTRTGSLTASSLGTRWLTTLRCDGTSVTVREGRVRVFDRVLRRTRILRPGQTYLARLRR